MQINTFFGNSSTCFSDFTNLSYVQMPYYKSFMADDDNALINKTIETTRMVKYFAKGAMDCESVLINMFLYLNNQVIV